ncbi:MAG: carboxylating nicotinate-nucleotide diphosphorylase [Ignavibacteria bacterium]|nr:carboxylating nicotinate-nucleotide diphosphorylase [Ignavibacteria bacterium]
MQKSFPFSSEIDQLIETALREDVGAGDITTNSLFDESTRGRAVIRSKASGILAGIPIAELVFKKLDAHMEFQTNVSDGMKISRGEVLAELSGSLRAILAGERVALNFLQHLSGIATVAGRFVSALDGTKTAVLDTRKTMPGLRALEKYAVRMGGGVNHRMGLYDAVLIKDNHIAAAGGIREAVERVRKTAPANTAIELEAANLDDVREALEARADIIMLDNMKIDELREAVAIVGGKAKLEASGGVTFESVREIADTGVDFVSIGSITHSAPALDIALSIV